jgi:hypothetical protein
MSRKSKSEIQKRRENVFARQQLYGKSSTSNGNIKKDRTKFFLFTQVIFFIACLFEVIFCCIYRSVDQAVGGDILLFIMVLLMYPVSFGIIVLPASVIYNIKKVILNYKQKSPRRIFGLIWTVLSPILHLVIFGLGGACFVAATGGV